MGHKSRKPNSEMKLLIFLQFSAFTFAFPTSTTEELTTTTVVETEPTTTDPDWTTPGTTSTTTDWTTTTDRTTTSTTTTSTTTTSTTTTITEDSKLDSTTKLCFQIFSLGWCRGESNEETSTFEPSTTVFTTIDDYLIVDVVVPIESSDQLTTEEQSPLATFVATLSKVFGIK